jgi:hypothetical protein
MSVPLREYGATILDKTNERKLYDRRMAGGPFVPKYPMINFLVRYGGLCALVIALVPPVAGLYLMIRGGDWLVLAGGIVAGVVTYGLLKSYSELVELMSDMLMPK